MVKRQSISFRQLSLLLFAVIFFTFPVFAQKTEQTKSLADFGTIAQAQDAIGSSTDTELIIPSAATISAPVTLTKNIRLKFTGTGSITVARGQTLTIENGLGLEAPLDKQIFTGAGNVYFSGSLPEAIYLEWFGARGDGVTSDNTAFDKFIMSFPPAKGAHLLFASGKTYYFANTLEFDATVVAESSGAEATGAAILKFGANKTGIIIHHQDTKTGVDNRRASFNSVFRNLKLVGNNGSGEITNTHKVSVSGTTVTRTSGAAFSLTGGYVEGNTITINGFTYVINSRKSDNELEIKPPRLLINAANGSAVLQTITNFYVPADNSWNGKTISVDGSAPYTIRSTNSRAGTITLTANFSGTTGTSYVAEVNGLATLAGLPARPNVFHGFDVREHSRIEGCRVEGFAGNAINIDNTSSLGNPNSNISRVDRNVATENYGSGIFTRGVNANQINFINNDLTENVGYGIWEHGFLGNRYFGNHTSVNRAGSTDVTSGGVNDSTFEGEYSEAGQLPAFYGQANLIIGGTHGADFAKNSEGSRIYAAQTTLRTTSLQTAQPINSKNTKAWMAGFGTGNFPNAIFEFGAGEEKANRSQGNPSTFADYAAFKLLYNYIANGLYTLHYKTNSLGTSETVLMAFSGSQAADGGGKLYFPTGFATQTGDAQVTRILSATANLDFTALAANSCENLTITVTGAADGDVVTLGVPSALASISGTSFTGFVSASNNVTVRRCNSTVRATSDPPGAAVRAQVTKF